MAAPTTLMAIFHAFEFPFFCPPGVGIGGEIEPGGAGAVAISLEFTTIEMCP